MSKAIETIEALAAHMHVDDKHLEFLRVYDETLSLEVAAKKSGVRRDNAIRSIKSNTPFAKLFKRLTKELDKDPRFNKAGAIGMLMELKDRARDSGKTELEFKIIQEINKMISGNIAASKKEVTKRNFNVVANIDLTKPPKKEIEAEETEYEEIED